MVSSGSGAVAPAVAAAEALPRLDGGAACAAGRALCCAEEGSEEEAVAVGLTRKKPAACSYVLGPMPLIPSSAARDG